MHEVVKGRQRVVGGDMRFLGMSMSVARCRWCVRSVLSWVLRVGSDGVTVPETLGIVDRGVGAQWASAAGRVR